MWRGVGGEGMTKAFQIAVTLSAYDKLSTIVNSAVDKSNRKLKSMQKAVNGFKEFGDRAILIGEAGTEFFEKTVNAAEQSEVAARRLQAVFNTKGAKNNDNAEQAERYAKALSLVIGIQHEDIELVQAKLAIQKSLYTESAKAAGVFDRATKLTFDMEATGFGVAAKNAQQLGKALEDPVKGMQGLRRVGIIFSTHQQKIIKFLVEHNEKLRAQKLILDALEKKFSGVAEKTALASSKAKVGWHEVIVMIGEKLLPMVNKAAQYFTTVLIPVFTKFIEKHGQLIKWLAILSVGFLALGTAIKVLAFAGGTLVNVFTILVGTIQFVGFVLGTVGRFLLANPIILIITAIAVAAYLIYKYWEPIKKFFINLWEKIKKVFAAAWQWIKNMFLNYTPAGLIIKHWEKITAFFSGLWNGVKNIFSNTWVWIKRLLWDYNPIVILFTHWNGIVAYFTALWEDVKNVFSKVWQWIEQAAIRMYQAGKNIMKNLWQGIKDGFSWFSSPADAFAKVMIEQQKKLNANTAAAFKGGNASLVYSLLPAANQNKILQQPGALQPAPVNNSNVYHFSPNVTLNGSATEQDAKTFMDYSKKDFVTMMKDAENNKKRVQF